MEETNLWCALEYVHLGSTYVRNLGDVCCYVVLYRWDINILFIVTWGPAWHQECYAFMSCSETSLVGREPTVCRCTGSLGHLLWISGVCIAYHGAIRQGSSRQSCLASSTTLGLNPQQQLRQRLRSHICAHKQHYIINYWVCQC